MNYKHIEEVSDILNENFTHAKIIEWGESKGLNIFDGEELASRIEAFIVQEVKELIEERQDRFIDFEKEVEEIERIEKLEREWKS